MHKTATSNSFSPGLQGIEEALALGDLDNARSMLKQLPRSIAGDIHDSRLHVRAALELSEWDIATGILNEIKERGEMKAATLLMESEVWISRGEIKSARELLETSSHNNHENIVIPALIEIFTRFESTNSTGSTPLCTPLNISSPALWFEPVLSNLLYFLEMKMEGSKESQEFHSARTTLIRPDLSPELFKNPKRGTLGKLLDSMRRNEVLEQKRREREIIQKIREKDFKAATQLIESWLGEDSRIDLSDPRLSLLIEILFDTDRFGDILDLLKIKNKEEANKVDPQLLLLAAYSELVHNGPGGATEFMPLYHSIQPPTAGSAHLQALISLKSGHPERAIPYLRRAFKNNDIGLVELARSEMKFLGLL